MYATPCIRWPSVLAAATLCTAKYPHEHQPSTTEQDTVHTVRTPVADDSEGDGPDHGPK